MTNASSSRTVLAGAFCAALSSATPALASVVGLSPGGYSSTASVIAGTDGGQNYDFQIGPLTYDQSRSGNNGPYGGTATARLAMDALGRPSILATTAGSAAASGYASARGSSDGYMYYEFVVHGPTATAPVRFDASGMFSIGPYSPSTGDTYFLRAGVFFVVNGQGPAGGLFQVFDQIDVTYGRNYTGAPVTQQGNASVTGSLAAGLFGTLEEHGTYLLATEKLYSVQIRATAEGTSFGDGVHPGNAFSISAFIDPVFSIAPGTPDAALYSIEVSAGVGNRIAAAVPEPSTWAMMLIGFAGLAIAGRRSSSEIARRPGPFRRRAAGGGGRADGADARPAGTLPSPSGPCAGWGVAVKAS